MKSITNKVLKIKDDLDLKHSKPTPKFWRRLGTVILSAGTTATVISSVYGEPWIVVTSAVLTFVGKTLTSFAS